MAQDVEDHGEWLNFRVDGVPVQVSREAMEDHFGAGEGTGSLVTAFRIRQAEIVVRVREVLAKGGEYTQQSPLLMRTSDF